MVRSQSVSGVSTGSRAYLIAFLWGYRPNLAANGVGLSFRLRGTSQISLQEALIASVCLSLRHPRLGYHLILGG